MRWPATRSRPALAAADSGSEGPLQGSVTLARSCAPSYAGDHHRNTQSAEPILHRATKRICFCEMLVAATTDPRRASLVRVPLLAISDLKARSSLHISKEGKWFNRFHPNRKYPAHPMKASSGQDLAGVHGSGPVHRVCRHASQALGLCRAVPVPQTGTPPSMTR
jgi:hypothetical protein